jgi:hypothetical protein
MSNYTYAFKQDSSIYAKILLSIREPRENAEERTVRA